jgi:hypothetical protein
VETIMTPNKQSSESTKFVSSVAQPKELQEKAEWLRNKLVESLENVGRKRNLNQRKATYVKFASIAFSGTATILLGLPVAGLDPLFRSIAFVLGALVTLLTAIEPFFNYRGLWVEHERARYRLHTLQDEFEYYMAGTISEKINAEKLNEFHQKYLDIFIDLSESWLQQREGGRVKT